MRLGAVILLVLAVRELWPRLFSWCPKARSQEDADEDYEENNLNASH